MTIPGFTAEASLEQTTSRHQMTTDSRKSQYGRVIPQAKIILDGFCIGNGRFCCFRGPDGKWTCGATIST